ncbi:MAG: ComF family protein [Candidatus Omnitrophota bacterium]|nr:ComF family protein [Candidatus Omnitrophota bacterium]
MPMLEKYMKAAKDIFLPSLCFYCEQKISKGYLCKSCQEKIELLYPPLCRFCSKQIENNKTGLCKQCMGKTFAYDRIISVTSYKEPMISLIHLFKYKNYDCLIDFFSSVMLQFFLKIGFDFSSYADITSVPMHHAKLRDRGYNQAALLAKSLANYFKIPFKDDIIYEKNERVSQTKLERQKRQESVKNAFLAKNNVSGKKIILVDDIFTTGATISECAWALKEKGAQIVTVITLSKTQ